MEHLSSCYFCGAAVEAEVDDYPIVRGSVEGVDLPPAGERPTVALCSSCRGKLDHLLDAGLGSAGAVDADAGASALSGDAGGAASESGGDSSVFEDAEPVPVEDEADAPTVGDSSGGDSGSTDRSGTGSDDVGSIQTDDDSRRRYTSSQAAGGRRSRSHSSLGGDSTDDQDARDETEDAGEDEQQESERPEVDEETYNSVVRLLQNRDFPLDPEEILAVATNAYDLDRHDCEDVLDHLVERGVLDRREGRLHRED